MHHRVNAMGRKGGIQSRLIPNVARDEGTPLNEFTVAKQKAVVDNDFGPGGGQRFGTMAANVTSSPSDQNFYHAVIALSRPSCRAGPVQPSILDMQIARRNLEQSSRTEVPPRVG